MDYSSYFKSKTLPPTHSMLDSPLSVVSPPRSSSSYGKSQGRTYSTVVRSGNTGRLDRSGRSSYKPRTQSRVRSGRSPYRPSTQDRLREGHSYRSGKPDRSRDRYASSYSDSESDFHDNELSPEYDSPYRPNPPSGRYMDSNKGKTIYNKI